MLYLLPIAAYLYGSIPFAFVLPKLLKGVDIRTVGSGNIGATNAARVLGFKFFPVIFLLDFSKGFVPVLAAKALAQPGRFDPALITVVSGAAGVLGHVYSAFLGFRGGKGVAASTGAMLALTPKATLAAAVVWAAVFVPFRYVSLASIVAALALPIAVMCMGAEPFGAGRYLTGFAIIGAAFVIWLHRANIARLLSGTEHRIGRKPNAE